MIAGIGTDMVELARIEAVLTRHGSRFARRVLAEIEWPDFAHSRDPVRLIAKRFAAKEAFAKAVGTGLRSPVLLSHLAVVHDDLGRPQWVFAEPLAAWLAERDIHRCHLSINDERAYCEAFVDLETD